MIEKYLLLLKNNLHLSLFFLPLFPICFFYPKYITVFCCSFAIFHVFSNLRNTNTIDKWFLFIVGLFLFIIFLSTLWSLNPWYTFVSSLKISFVLVLIFLFFQRLDSLYEQREKILTMIYFGLLLTSLIILINFYYGNLFESFRKLSTGKLLTPIGIMLSLFMWPALLFLEKKGSVFLEKGFFSILLFFSLFKTDCDTAILNVISSFLFFLLILLFGNLTLYVTGAGLVFGLLFSPLIAYFLFKENGFIFNKFISVCSYIDRINIWNRLSEKVLLSPLTGYGFKSSRFLPADQKEIYSYFKSNGKITSFISPTIPLHPHNFALELWIELGFFGVFIFSGLIFLCFSYMIKIKDLKEKAFYFAFFTSIISTMLYSLSIWQTWWIFTMFLGFVLMKFSENKTTPDQI